MTPNSKDAMTPAAPKRRITRSVTFKLGLAEFSSVGFFSSHGTTCDPSQRAEVSAELYQAAYDEVEQAVRDYKAGIGQIVEEVLHPERSHPQEESPFKVSARPAEVVPTPAVAQPTPSNEVAKEEVVQRRQGEDKAVSEKSSEKSTEAPKRGRPKNPPAAEPGVEAATAVLTGTPKPAAPPAEPKGQPFQATDDDLPKAIGGTSEVPPPGPDLKAKHEEIRAAEAAKAAGPQLVPKPAAQWDRFVAVIDALSKEGKRTRDNVEAAVKDMCRGFLNLEKLPKPPDSKYDPIIPILESLARLNPGVIMAEPKKAGLEAGVGWNKFSRHTEKWSERLRGVATDVAIAKYPDNCMDLLDFLNGSAKLSNLDAELGTFLLVFRSTNAAIAMALRAASTEQNKPMAEIMKDLDFSTATEGQILERISGVTKEPAKTGDLWQE